MTHFLCAKRFDGASVFVNLDNITFIAPYNKECSEIYFNDGEAEPLRINTPIEKINLSLLNAR